MQCTLVQCSVVLCNAVSCSIMQLIEGCSNGQYRCREKKVELNQIRLNE